MGRATRRAGWRTALRLLAVAALAAAAAAAARAAHARLSAGGGGGAGAGAGAGAGVLAEEVARLRRVVDRQAAVIDDLREQQLQQAQQAKQGQQQQQQQQQQREQQQEARLQPRAVLSPPRASPAASAGSGTGNVSGVSSTPLAAALDVAGALRRNNVSAGEVVLPAGLSHETPVFLACATASMQHFLRNWATHVARARVPNVLVGAFDESTAALARKLGLRHVDSLVWEYEGMATGGASLHSKQAPVIRHSAPMHALGILRAQLLVALLARGHSVFVSDVDTVWLRDPTHFFGSHPSCVGVDAALGNDCISAEGDAKHQGWLNSQLNVGLILLRPTPLALELVARWQGQLERPGTAHVNDQDLMGRIIQMRHVKRAGPWSYVQQMPAKRGDDVNAFFAPPPGAPAAPPSLGSQHARTEDFKGVEGLTFGVLPVDTFMGGHTYFSQRLHERHGAAAPLVVHATFQFSHSHGKRQRFREDGLWLDDPDAYYNPTNGFLTFVPEVPNWKALEREVLDERRRAEAGAAKNGAPSEAREAGGAFGDTDALSLIDRQMLAAHLHRLEAYNAFAIARTLNRTLVLPHVTCWCERYWGVALPKCVMPNSDSQLPYRCPMDHLYFLSNLDGLQWREEAVLRSERFEGRGGARAAVCVEGVQADADCTLHLPAYASDAAVRSALGNAPPGRVLELRGAAWAFGAFTAAGEDHAFHGKLAKALSADVFFCDKTRACRVGYKAPAKFVAEVSKGAGEAGGWRRRFAHGGLGEEKMHP